ncbi:MAG: hypothetical protein LBC17_00240 [Lactobacillaceae bacterium]|jgi:hypothetical protein|nr:hypothetical protein [Lactobacillaceae bacterium]
MISQLLNLVIGGLLGVAGQKISGSLTGSSTQGTTNNSILNIVISVVSGFLGANLGGLIPGLNSIGGDALTNLFGTGFNLVPGVVGSTVLSGVVGAILGKIKK